MLPCRTCIFQTPEEVIDWTALGIACIDGCVSTIRLPESFTHHTPPELQAREIRLGASCPRAIKVDDADNRSLIWSAGNEYIVRVEVLMTEYAGEEISK